MKVLLVSTYELGRQPVHVASPAAALERRGHDVRVTDTSVDDLDSTMLDWAEAVAISVPMHTAKRLANSLTGEMKAYRPDLPVAHYGLYAGVGFSEDIADAALEGEYETALIEWVGGVKAGIAAEKSLQTHRGSSQFEIPERSRLPGVDQYARIEHDGTTKLVGAVEASHGCRHRCRHCPIPAVYDGRIRIVPEDIVLADIHQLAAAGAEHITFGDPDFLNAPAHTVSVLERAHQAHPDMTFDITVKVEHILAKRDIWPRMAELGLLFVVSAFESTNNQTLEVLDKGHTVADMSEAVGIIRDAGIYLRPTWLPFLPWAEHGDIVGILDFLTEHDLAAATDPVQLAIKLLVPSGSLLESHPAMTPYLDEYDGEALSWTWRYADPDMDALQVRLESIAAEASDCAADATTTLRSMWAAVTEMTGVRLADFTESSESVPRLTESWFCCAEPTQGQTVSLQIGRPG